MVKIGEDRTERLDIVPAQLRVIVTVRPKYACRACEQGVTQASAPAWLIEGGLPTEGAIAHVLVSKYAEYTPLYRQSATYACSGRRGDAPARERKRGCHAGARRRPGKTPARRGLSLPQHRAPPRTGRQTVVGKRHEKCSPHAVGVANCHECGKKATLSRKSREGRVLRYRLEGESDIVMRCSEPGTSQRYAVPGTGHFTTRE